MSVVDPTALARFKEAQARPSASGRFAYANPSFEPATPSEKWAQQRLRMSPTHIGAIFRGLEKEIGSDPALEVVAALIAREGN